MRQATTALVLLFVLVGAVGCLTGPSDRSGKPIADPTQASPTYANGAVAADHPIASRIGVEILQKGGNAVDAAVATSFALSVVRMYSCGIGGGGFMLIHLADDPRTPAAADAVTIALDYRERAPAAVDPEHFESLPEDASRFTGHAVAIPGTVAGLLHALDRYGTMSRADVLEPVIRLARTGWTVDPHTYSAMFELDNWLRLQTLDEPGRKFMFERFTSSGRPLIGDRLTLPEQGRALQLIADDGAAAFYRGEIADAMISAVQRHGGVLTHADLAGYEPKESAPLVGTFSGRTILTMPLPSSGGITMLQMLAMLECRRDVLDRRDADPSAYRHLLIEVMKHAFADRAAHLGDPEFDEIPVDHLLDDSYLRSRAMTIELDRTLEPAHYGDFEPGPSDGGTSHFCVVDRWGNAVSCTETINLLFGSRLCVPEFGFCLNNEMDDFLTRRGRPNYFGLLQSDRNLPESGKRPLSSMAPTIVLNADGAVELLIGASGGPRIITSTFQAMLHVVLDDRSAFDAVTAPRLHHQWAPDVVFFESYQGNAFSPLPSYFSAEQYSALSRRGHVLQMRDAIGHVQLIRRVRGAERWAPMSDPRKNGLAAGY